MSLLLPFHSPRFIRGVLIHYCTVTARSPLISNTGGEQAAAAASTSQSNFPFLAGAMRGQLVGFERAFEN